MTGDMKTPVTDIEVNGRSMDVTIYGQVFNVPYSRWPKLDAATDAQRKKVEISNLGLHWDEIDLDISLDSVMHGDRTAV